MFSRTIIKQCRALVLSLVEIFFRFAIRKSGIWKLTLETSLIITPTKGETICTNCADLDLHSVFRGKFKMGDGFISSKGGHSVRWTWQQVKHSSFCSFWDKCSVFRTIIYDLPELDAQLQPRWLKHEKFKWFEDDKLIFRLVFDTPLAEESWLNHTSSRTSFRLQVACSRQPYLWPSSYGSK
jgi:hypothetical protein